MSVPPYRSLPSADCIRLLQIKPSDSLLQIVDGELRVVDLNDTPAYRCLSYTWDGPRHEDTGPQWTIESEWLVLNGVRKAVRLNLSNALRSLREVRVTDPVWMDSICINQEHTAERNSQVAQMVRIFQNAVDVIVWLGEPQLNANKVMEKLGGPRMAPAEARLMTALDAERFWARMITRILERHSTREEAINVVDFLVGIRWFSRVWTLQEMLLAADLKFLWGGIWIDFDCMFGGSFLILGLIGVYGLSRPDLSDLYATECVPWVENFSLDMMDKHIQRSTGAPCNQVSMMMKKARSRVATDPKDKVYGLFGLSSKCCLYLAKRRLAHPSILTDS